MVKTVRKRLLAFGAAAIVGLSAIPVNLIANAAPEDGDPGGASAQENPVFSFTADDLTYDYYEQTGYYQANDLAAKINFKDANGSDLSITTGENEYYLLLHGVGSENGYYQQNMGWTTVNTPIDTEVTPENKNAYLMVPIQADGTSWSGGKIEKLFSSKPQEITVTDWFGNTRTETVDVFPGTALLEGYIVKNDDTSVDLTTLGKPDIEERNGFHIVSGIKGALIDADDSQIKSDYMGTRIEMDAVAGHLVNVEYYDFDGETPCKVETDESAKYYVLAKLRDEAGNIVAYSSTEIKPEENAASSVVLWEFNEIDADGNDTGTTVTYDPDVYELIVDGSKDGIRVYHTMTSSQSPSGYNDFADMTILTDDTIAPFIFVSNKTEGNVTTIKSKKEHVTFDLKLEFEDTATISGDDNYYLLLDTEHQSGDHSYYWTKLDLSGEKEYVISLQDSENTEWKWENGTKTRISGGEKEITAKIYRGKNDTNLSNLIKSDGCSVVTTVGKYSYYEDTDENTDSNHKHLGADKTETSESGQVTKKYTYTLHFGEETVPDEYTFKSILGNGLIIVYEHIKQNFQKLLMIIHFYDI